MSLLLKNMKLYLEGQGRKWDQFHQFLRKLSFQLKENEFIFLEIGL